MGTKTIRIDVQMNNALVKVLGEIQEGISFASVGERFSKTDITELPEDDTVVKIPIGKIREDPKDIIDNEVKEKFAQYCKRYSIIAIVSACEVYLQTLLLIITVVIRLRDKKQISHEELQLLRQEWRNQLWSLGGLRLLDECVSLLDNKVAEISTRKYFSDINKMRRCIVHRGGIISEQEVGKSGILQITVRKPELVIRDVVIDKLPYKTEKEGDLKFRSVEETFTWKTGQSLIPNIQLCQNIGWTLIWFCNEVHKKLGQSINNLIKTNPESFPPQAQ